MFRKHKSLFQSGNFCTSSPITHTFISTTFHHFFKVNPTFHHVPIISLVHDTMQAAILNPTSPNMKISTPLLRIARDISPYLGSMARISLKERKRNEKGKKLGEYLFIQIQQSTNLLIRNFANIRNMTNVSSLTCLLYPKLHRPGFTTLPKSRSHNGD